MDMDLVRLRTFTDAEQALQPYIPIVHEMTGKDITLERMTPLMEQLGNPQERIKVIHVAGTSGKTSTAYYIADLLTLSGKTVGLTVSPHIDLISERLQINMKPLDETQFCEVLREFLGLIKGVEPRPSYFELLMAMAYWYFAKIGVDYAVIETGFGGLHDASNICKNPDKICILTDIGMDHMHILGHSVSEISVQKAGIMHQGNLAFTFKQANEVLEQFKAYASSQGAKLVIVNQDAEQLTVRELDNLNKLPIFQQRNWLMAHHVYEYLEQRDNLPALTNDVLQASLMLVVPGRMELVEFSGKTIIMDGAHNEQKMTAFVRSFQAKYPGRSVPVLLGMKTGKEYMAVLPLLKPITSQLIVTSFESGQDLPSKPIDPEVLADAAKRNGFESVAVYPDYQTALMQLVAVSGDIAVITGSFYLLASVRPHMLRV